MADMSGRIFSLRPRGPRAQRAGRWSNRLGVGLMPVAFAALRFVKPVRAASLHPHMSETHFQ